MIEIWHLFQLLYIHVTHSLNCRLKLDFVGLTCVHLLEQLSDLGGDHSIRVGAPATANSQYNLKVLPQTGGLCSHNAQYTYKIND